MLQAFLFRFLVFACAFVLKKEIIEKLSEFWSKVFTALASFVSRHVGGELNIII